MGSLQKWSRTRVSSGSNQLCFPIWNQNQSWSNYETQTETEPRRLLILVILLITCFFGHSCPTINYTILDILLKDKPYPTKSPNQGIPVSPLLSINLFSIEFTHRHCLLLITKDWQTWSFACCFMIPLDNSLGVNFFSPGRKSNEGQILVIY